MTASEPIPEPSAPIDEAVLRRFAAKSDEQAAEHEISPTCYRDLARAYLKLRAENEQLRQLRNEWVERFGHLATKHAPDAIEAIDEVACLLNERTQWQPIAL